jgi:hypothetical protein
MYQIPDDRLSVSVGASVMTIFKFDLPTRWLHPGYGTDLPDGQISEFPVQPLLQKYSSSALTQISNISLTVPSHRGALARSSRTRGGMRWTLIAL